MASSSKSKGKRKNIRSPAVSPKRVKKSKVSPTSPIPAGFWIVRDILEEDQDSYLIDWATDSEGRSYSPTWEAKGNVTEGAVADWERRKFQRPRERKVVHPTRSSSTYNTEDRNKVPKVPARVVPSNPEKGNNNGISVREIPENLHVILPQKPVDATEYLSSFPSSQAANSSGQTAEEPVQFIESSQSAVNSATSLSTADGSTPDLAHFGRSSIIPDSQSQLGSASFIPSNPTRLGNLCSPDIPRSKSTTPESFAGDLDNSLNDILPSESDRIESSSQYFETIDSPQPNTHLSQQVAHIVARASHSLIRDSQGTFRSQPSSHSQLSRELGDHSPTRSRSQQPNPSFENSDRFSAAVSTRLSIQGHSGEQSLSAELNSNLGEALSSRRAEQHLTTGPIESPRARKDPGVSDSVSWQDAQRIGSLGISASEPLASQNHTQLSSGSFETTSSVLSHKDPNSVKQPSRFHENANSHLSKFSTIQHPSESPIPPPPSSTNSRLGSWGTHSLPPSVSNMTDLPGPLHGTAASLDVVVDPAFDEQKADSNEMKPTTSLRELKSPSAIPEASSMPSLGAFNEQHPSLRSELSPSAEAAIGTDSPLINVDGAGLNADVSSQVVDSILTLQAPLQDKVNHTLLLPMSERIRDQYHQIIYNHHFDIEAFVNSETPDSLLITRMEGVASSLRHLSIHSDLLVPDTVTQVEVDDVYEAKWAENSSARFDFLGHFFDYLKGHHKHVLILACGERVLQLLEVFLRGKGITCTTDGKNSPMAGDGQAFKVTLNADERDGEPMPTYSSVDLVIQFNGLPINPTTPRRPSPGFTQAPVWLSLVVANSTEHVDLCLPSFLKPLLRLQALVSCVTQIRFQVGRLPDASPPVATASKAIAEYMTTANNGDQAEWPFSPVLGPPGVGSLLESQQSTDSSQGDENTSAGTDSNVTDAPRPLKRQLDLEDEGESGTPKKARLTPIPFPPPDHSTFQGSTSTIQPMLGQFTTSGLVHSVDTPAYSEENGMLKETMRKQAEKLKQLQGLLAASDSSVRAKEDDMNELQGRFEKQVQDTRDALKERDEARKEAALIERQRMAQTGEMQRLRENQSQLRSELESAQRALESSAVPAIAQFAEVQRALKDALAETESLRKRLESATRDFQFSTTQYQVASNAAVDAAREVSDLREENEELKRKASGEVAKLRHLNYEAETERHLKRIAQLELTLEEREEQVRRREDELKMHMRGKGLATRASSVPKSPRPYSRASSPNVALGSKLGQHPLRQG
ncbi:MAG: hypothetical protein M1825_005920 [Sarcosagium campestre]|nr:MAG: hypothetical protein M1825_005920 [Sarcosagium campestre]